MVESASGTIDNLVPLMDLLLFYILCIPLNLKIITQIHPILMPLAQALVFSRRALPVTSTCSTTHFLVSP